MSASVRRLVFSLFTLATLVSGPGLAQPVPYTIEDLVGDGCVASRPPVVTVGSTPFEWRLERRYTTAEIDAFANGYDVSLQSGSRTIGLTVAVINGDGRFTSSVRSMPDGKWCASLDTVDVALGYGEPLVVFVGGEYPESSCAYEAILSHELEHVALYRSSMMGMVGSSGGIIEDGVQAFHSAASGDTARDANFRLQEKLSSVVARVVERVTDETQSVNGRIDTPESYAQVFAQCNDWNSFGSGPARLSSR